jgi:ADP-heptose:LPS heptosyltransferase
MTRILIVKMWALGDILLATPLLRALKGHYGEDCSITWLADHRYAGVLEGNPLVDEVIAFDSPLWRRYYRYGQWLSYGRMSSAMRRDLLARRFDIVINLTAEKWWSIWFQVAPVRVGLFPRLQPGLIGRLYTHAVPRPAKPMHNSDHYLLAAESLGISGPHDRRMVAAASTADRAGVESFLRAQPGFVPERPLVILHPGTSQETKCWPTEHFAALADSLLNDFTVVVTGSPAEGEMARDIVEKMGARGGEAIVAAGTLPRIGHLVAMTERAAVVVTGDTSALHIASAVDTPVVCVYGSTRPDDNRPQFGTNVLLFDDAIPCAPCHKSHCALSGGERLQCLRAVTPERVRAEALRIARKHVPEGAPTR